MSHTCEQLPAALCIGTSGWSYAHWQHGFYTGVPRRDWLGFYATHFRTVEINATFYRRQSHATLTHWCDSVPQDFTFTLKANRYITHSKRLRDPDAAVATERDNNLALADRLAAVLWQLPQNLGRDMQRLEDFARALSCWRAAHVIEFRHASWFTEEVAQCLRHYRIGNCLSDAADWPCWEKITAPLVYIRLHGHSRTYASRYSQPQLERWAALITPLLDEGRRVHVYFDNDAAGHAPRDAQRLCQLLAATR